MNRYYKLQNGDIFDNQTRTTISREKLLEILNWGETIDLELYDELDRDKNSVLD